MKKDKVYVSGDFLVNDSVRAISAIPPEEQSINLVVDGETILSIKKDGVYYKDRLLKIDKEIEDAFRDFFTRKGIL